jgi:uncharacterized protein YabE (DUF348 family)
VQKRVYVTAHSVDDALNQLGYRADNLVLSASRSERLPLSGMQLSISTPKNVTLVADGQQRVVTTTAGTVADLLQQQGLTLGPEDRMTLQPTQALTENTTLQLVRVKSSKVTVTSPVPHKSVETPDPNALQGQRTVTRPGADGEQATTFKVTTTDGVETARQQLSSTVTRQPVDELVTVGTKPKATVAPAADGLNWAALAKCESGGNPKAVNPAGYYGLYQFSLSTWSSVGGTGNPTDASAAEQTARAQALYARGGAGQWGCGKHLSD